ncbi:MAG: WYL domain-containing protein [Campylobacteraceae bacterium]|jgi:predicted DNA-binding transcriptional regulator YafY|nr:WYL domain-containing protein [Campylobacteraceae bacterium]
MQDLESMKMNNKTAHILTLLQKLCSGEELYPQKESILNELGIDTRTLERYLKEIKDFFTDAILTEKRFIKDRAKSLATYRMINENDAIKILKILLEKNSSDFGWIFPLVYENDMKFLKEFNDKIRDAITRIVKKNNDIFLFKTNPFENTQNIFFMKLQKAVENMEYRNITYEYKKTETLNNVKCLKLIFVNNNWYLACESQKQKFNLLRISFIKNVTYSKKKERYQRGTLSKYESYFDSMQNAMTLQGVKPQEAILCANKNIACYFKKEMKPFFASQCFIEEVIDGSIIFSVSYTQPLEVLPFIKNWLPDIMILEPQSLKAELKKELKKALSYI